MDYLKMAKDVLELESQAIARCKEALSATEVDKLIEIYKYLGQIDGNLIFSGVGKSGFVARKLASTFSSLGLPSFFLHPVEALHGDLGRFRKNDVLVMISKSGATEELVALLTYLEIDKDRLVGLLGITDSVLGKKCGLVMDCSVPKEACINNQAPTTSTTVAMAMGDAMAVVYEGYVGLSKEGFAVNHPAGALGKALRLKVRGLMSDKSDCPTASEETTIQDVILAMTQRPLGGCAIIDSNGVLKAIVVEGDIRRAFAKSGITLESPVKEIMGKNPITIGPDELAYEALRLMEARKNPITLLPVIDQDKKFLGLIRLHDLLKQGLNSLN